MKKKQRRKAFWMASVAALAIAAIVVSILVFADSEPVVFTATLYSDVIRFEAEGVASLRVAIYDLSENELWSSGQVMGDFVDWDRTNERGERLANGYYLYFAQGWDSDDRLILNKTGKVVLLPGDRVELKSAPVVVSPSDPSLFGEVGEPIYGPKTYNATNWYVSGKLGVGTDSPSYAIHNMNPTGAAYIVSTDGSLGLTYIMGTSIKGEAFVGSLTNHDFDLRANNQRGCLHIGASTGNVGVGTVNPTDKLTVEGASGNLIACYPDSSRAANAAVFRVESDGDVYADGTVYSQATAVGQADVAERINVSEWVEAGDVVEIDPEHFGFFRKASGMYSRRVAGIISTSPGVILGNKADPQSDAWDDNRPVLAIAGRVPVKASTENGPIAVGDLLVSSSVPGLAMKGEPSVSVGAVVGKAMEALESGEGVIMAQVTLR
jgi:hypothetical protein